MHLIDCFAMVVFVCCCFGQTSSKSRRGFQLSGVQHTRGGNRKALTLHCFLIVKSKQLLVLAMRIDGRHNHSFVFFLKNTSRKESSMWFAYLLTWQSLLRLCLFC